MQVEQSTGTSVAKQVTSRSGEKYSIQASAESHVSLADLQYERVGPRHHLYRYHLEGLREDHLCVGLLRYSGGHEGLAPFAFPVLPDATSQVAPPMGPEIGTLEVGYISDTCGSARLLSRLSKLMAMKNPHLVIHNGNIVPKADDLYAWEAGFFDPMRDLLTRAQLVLNRGRGDTRGALRSYYLPGPLPAHQAFSAGAARWIVLDSTIESEGQMRWLESELSKPSTLKAPFRIVLCPDAPFRELGGPLEGLKQNDYIRTRMVPLFEKYRVDVVFSGGSGHYQRGIHNGVNYIVSGVGPEAATVRLRDYKIFKKTIMGPHYLQLRINREACNIRLFSPSDELLDSFHVPRSFARKMKPTEMLPQ